MEGKKTVDSARRDSRGLLRLGTLPALNWILLAYAAVVIGIAWAYAGSLIHGDYEQTLEEERTRRRHRRSDADDPKQSFACAPNCERRVYNFWPCQKVRG